MKIITISKDREYYHYLARVSSSINYKTLED
jgi:hypothetical protein